MEWTGFLTLAISVLAAIGITISLRGRCAACRSWLGYKTHRYTLTVASGNGLKVYEICERCSKTGREPKDAKMH
jgi:hypothetical protein